MRANMAAPWIDGTSNSNIYISKDIDILKEHLSVTILNYNQAEFDVRYVIYTDSRLLNVPFVFDTQADNHKYRRGRDDHMNFGVWLDDREVTVQDIPYMYRGDSIGENWARDLRKNFDMNIDDLFSFKYFELDLAEGVHVIHVKYTANATIDLWRDVKRYVFAYNLRPARYWKSFGGLELTVDASDLDGEISLDIPDGTFVEGAYNHYFAELPADEFYITCTPHISSSAEMFMAFGSYGLALTVSVCLIIIHFILMYRSRKKNPKKKFPHVAVIGSLIIPFVFCFAWVYGEFLIDDIIGEHASARHGYIFLLLLGYPFLLILYLIAVLTFDWIFKRKFAGK